MGGVGNLRQAGGQGKGGTRLARRMLVRNRRRCVGGGEPSRQAEPTEVQSGAEPWLGRQAGRRIVRADGELRALRCRDRSTYKQKRRGARPRLPRQITHMRLHSPGPSCPHRLHHAAYLGPSQALLVPRKLLLLPCRTNACGRWAWSGQSGRWDRRRRRHPASARPKRRPITRSIRP